MSKIDEFKNFAKQHPELINYLNNHKDYTWQKLYEIYDVYGEDDKIWSNYLLKESKSSLSDVINKIDSDTISEHIKTAQKALSLIEGLTTKGTNNINDIKGPTSPRPLSKFFGD